MSYLSNAGDGGDGKVLDKKIATGRESLEVKYSLSFIQKYLFRAYCVPRTCQISRVWRHISEKNGQGLYCYKAYIVMGWWERETVNE